MDKTIANPGINDNDDGEMCPEELKLLEEIETVKERLDSVRQAVQDTDFFKMTEHVKELGRLKFKICKQLRAHLSKVTSLDWASDSQLLVTASQDGKLIVWDTHSGNKLHMIPLNVAWVIGCGFAPSCRFVCSGGLDNLISVFDLQTPSGPEAPCIELNGHNGYVSSCKFQSDECIISASGDKSCAFWNLESNRILSTYNGHENDVTCLDVNKKDPNIFVTASADKTCRLWDVRIPLRYVQVFEGHEQDVNGVGFFPECSFGFVSASDDRACRLWDIRSDQCIAIYSDDYIKSGSTSVTLSKSGRILIAGYDDYICHAWDLLREERVGMLSAHDGRISGVKVSPDGVAIATCSWDTTCLIWTSKRKGK